ncbi:MAG: S8 family serine peptidase [Thermodesulfobacteriota bacterium]
MMKKRSLSALFLAPLVFSAGIILLQSPPCAAQADSVRELTPPTIPAGKGKGEEIIPGQYIVRFSAEPLSVYRGGLPGLPPTSPKMRGDKKLDVLHPDSLNYLNYLQENQKSILLAMEKEVGRGLSVARTYRTAFNGVAVKMSAAEARRIAQLPGVASVSPDKMRQLHTDNGPQWIGADDIWNGVVSTESKGEGIVIGVIDTGINPANTSFADVGGDGYDHSNPRARYYGFCDSTHADYNPAFLCNDKLIGAYDLTRTPPTPAVLYDNDGHGSHTASTAAGNVVNSVSIVAPTTTLNRPISGVAPHSNIISYKGCIPDGCPLSALVAAIDQATADGVDVINYSIGGSATDPWIDSDSLAFLNARQAGVFVATSAGNSGPGSGTVGSPGNSPWLMTVGNSSHNRRFVNILSSLSSDGTSLPDIVGVGLTGSLPATDIVYAGDYGDPLCPLGEFAAGTFTGQIVVCDRGTYGRIDKGTSVLNGGAGGMVLANDAANGNSLNADGHVLPAVHITYTDGVTLKNWLGVSSNHQASIAGSTVDINPVYGDIMTASSSRGANLPVPDVIKPDVSAPGLDILAANGTNNAATWGLMTGTSMASPHAAGAAALILSLHPDWTPAEVQSALMSTAYSTTVRKEDGATAADPFDTGAGRVDVSQAAQAGFVLDETHANYQAADPYLGGDPKTLNIPSLAAENILTTASWTRALTSTAAASVNWTTSVTNPPGVVLTVNPASFTLAPGGTQEVTITADASSDILDNWLFGMVHFTPDAGNVAASQFPVALKRKALMDLRYDEVRKRSSVIEQDLQVSRDITSLTATSNGLTAAATDTANLYQDPTPYDPFNGNWDPDDASNKDGLWVRMITVPAGTKRLVTQIVKTDSPDMDMYLYRWDEQVGWEWYCSSVNFTSDEYCSVNDPEAGDYYAWIQNYEASDPTGTTPDNVELAIAVVPGTSAGNLTVALAGGGPSVPAGQPFDLNISWNLAVPDIHWYGRFGLGTDAGNPDNLGLINLDLHVKPGGLFFPIKGKDGKTTVIQLK